MIRLSTPSENIYIYMYSFSDHALETGSFEIHSYTRRGTTISIDFVFVSRDKRDTRARERQTRVKHYVFRNRSSAVTKKSYPGLISKVNLSRGLIKTEDRNRGPCSRTICPCCPPASVAIVRPEYPRGRSQRGRYFFT